MLVNSASTGVTISLSSRRHIQIHSTTQTYTIWNCGCLAISHVPKIIANFVMPPSGPMFKSSATTHPLQAAPPLSTSVIEQLQEAKKLLWDKWIPSMIGGYFSDLTAVLNRIISSLLDDGQCWIVVGDSRYAGITVPVAQILSELSQHQGWTIERCEPIRHMKSSAQQGWRPELAET